MFCIFWLLAFSFTCTLSQYMNNYNPQCPPGVEVAGIGSQQRIEGLSERLHLVQVEMELCEIMKQIDSITNNNNNECFTSSIKDELEKVIDIKTPDIVDKIVADIRNDMKIYMNMYFDEKQQVKATTQVVVPITAAPQVVTPAIPQDCLEIRNSFPMKGSGIYQIKPLLSLTPVSVYCDMDSYGGGWTVVLLNGLANSNQLFSQASWEEYKQGFSNLEGDRWLGLESLFVLTNSKFHELMFEITPNGKFETPGTFTARYKEFRIGDEHSRYRITHLNGYSGNAVDSFSENRGKMFHTFDRDTTDKNCASQFRGKGGWWHYTDSMTPYIDCGKTSSVHWYPITSENIAINAQRIKMMIRPVT